MLFICENSECESQEPKNLHIFCRLTLKNVINLDKIYFGNAFGLVKSLDISVLIFIFVLPK